MDHFSHLYVVKLYRCLKRQKMNQGGRVVPIKIAKIENNHGKINLLRLRLCRKDQTNANTETLIWIIHPLLGIRSLLKV